MQGDLFLMIQETLGSASASGSSFTTSHKSLYWQNQKGRKGFILVESWKNQLLFSHQIFKELVFPQRKIRFYACLEKGKCLKTGRFS